MITPEGNCKVWHDKPKLFSTRSLSALYLLDEPGDGLYQATVLLGHEAIPSLLLLQSFFVALPQKGHEPTGVLRGHGTRC